MLNITSDLADTELLLQQHFMAVLSSVWRSKCRLQSPLRESSRDCTTRPISDIQTPHSRKWNYSLVSTALASATNSDVALSNNKTTTSSSNNYSSSTTSERMDLILAFPNAGDEVVETGFPTALNVSVHGNNDTDLPSQHDTGTTVSPSALLDQSSCSITENRFRYKLLVN